MQFDQVCTLNVKYKKAIVSRWFFICQLFKEVQFDY